MEGFGISKNLATKSIHLYQKLSLFRLTVCKVIKEMSQDVEETLKKT